MAEARQNKKGKLRLWVVLCLILVLWVGINFIRNAVINNRLKQEIYALQRQIEVLELRGRELEREIADWKSAENIERVAREELGLVKPGETMYILSEPLEGDVEHDVKKR